MRILSAVVVLSTVVAAPPASSQTLIVRPDARIELLSIVFHLAGADVYNQAQIARYARDVDSTFGPFRDHPVVRRARKLQDSLGIGYADPMVFAVHLSDAHAAREIAPLVAGPESQWTAPVARTFRIDLQQFVRDAPTDRFLRAHATVYDPPARRLRRL